MTTFIQSFKNRTLPISQTDSNQQQQQQHSLRRRLSSLSLKIKPLSSSPAASWAFRRSKSVSSMGEHAGNSVKKWWDWGWSWISSRKLPVFAKDLEMNEEEIRILGGSHNRGSLKHVFYKVRYGIRKLVGSDTNVRLPQTYKYNSFDYSKNFDDGSVRS